MWQIKHETGQHVRIILKINDSYHSDTLHAEVATNVLCIIKIDIQTYQKEVTISLITKQKGINYGDSGDITKLYIC